ncbi:MAG: DUF4124 domain-containing protein [Thiobacillaceae bacterium]|jgi:hypothetical protein
MGFKHRLLIMFALWLGMAQLVSADGSSKKLYRWVDDKGHVHYGDTLPATAGISGSEELGKSGQVMKRSESLAERKVRLAEEAEAARIKKEKDEQNRLDQALLGTYTSEKEIDLARDRALEFHQLAINSAQIRISQVVVNQKEVNANAEAFFKRGKAVPAYLQNQIDANQAELDSLNRIIKANQEALIGVRQKYDEDKHRYRELTGR